MWCLQIDELSNRLAALTEQTQLRLSNARTTLGTLESFHGDMAVVDNDLEHLMSELYDETPLGGDVEVIKQQQETFKVSPMSKLLCQWINFNYNLAFLRKSSAMVY